MKGVYIKELTLTTSTPNFDEQLEKFLSQHSNDFHYQYAEGCEDCDCDEEDEDE